MQLSSGESAVPVQQKTTVKPVTWIGLILAFFGAPGVIFLFNQIVGNRPLNDTLVFAKETAVFAVAGILILIVLKGEKLGLDSIGLHNRHWGKSIGLAMLGLLACIVLGALTLFLLQLAGISFGSGSEPDRYAKVSPWAITYMVLRAGIVEEIMYRGYIMERLEKMTGNWFVYFLMPLVLFAAWHYRQGIGGIVISFVLGFVLAFMYWKKRDLKANIITHFLGDFIPNVVFPLFA